MQFQAPTWKNISPVSENNGTSYFSMLAPVDCCNKPPHTFLGSYQLQIDLSWIAIEELSSNNDETEEIVRRLLKD